MLVAGRPGIKYRLLREKRGLRDMMPAGSGERVMMRAGDGAWRDGAKKIPGMTYGCVWSLAQHRAPQ